MIEGFKEGDQIEVTDEGTTNAGIPKGTRGVVRPDWEGDGDKTVRVVFGGPLGSQPLSGKGWLMYGGEIQHVVEAKPDAITPDHYKFGNVQVIDIIKYLPFNEGNVIKYVARADRKGNKLEDLRKAQKYLNLAIEIAEEEDGRNPSLS